MKIKNTPARTILSLSALALLITGGLLYAGPLDPPTGPITSTYKTLTEVEPRTAINATNTPGDADSLFKITLPGSYYLTGNITGVVGRHGIEIVASGVTLDLNGFELRGVAGSLDGMSTTVSGLTNIGVVNGSVRTWGGDGIDLGSMTATNCRVDGVRASGNAGTGIRVGETTGVTNCEASNNVGSGIAAGGRCVISACSATGNTTHGISGAFSCVVNACAATSNGGNGIALGGASSVANCSSSFNTGTGIFADGSSTVSLCSSSVNGGNGIRSSFGSIIVGNICRQNGNGASDGAGIHVTGFHNRIEGNNCSTADCGIDVDLGGNIIIKTTPFFPASGPATSSFNGLHLKSKFLAIAGGVVFAQVPLTPPGALAPGMRALDQIVPRMPISSLPFPISTAGSWANFSF